MEKNIAVEPKTTSREENLRHALFVIGVLLLCVLLIVAAKKLFIQNSSQKPASTDKTTAYLQSLATNKTVTGWNIIIAGKITRIKSDTLTVKNGTDSVDLPVQKETAFYRMPLPSVFSQQSTLPTITLLDTKQLKVGNLIRASVVILPNQAPRTTIISLIPAITAPVFGIGSPVKPYASATPPSPPPPSKKSGNLTPIKSTQ